MCTLAKQLSNDVRFIFLHQERVVTDSAVFVYKKGCLTYVQNIRDMADYVEGVPLDGDNILLLQGFQSKLSLLSWSSGYQYSKATRDGSPFTKRTDSRVSGFAKMKQERFNPANPSVLGVYCGSQIYQIAINKGNLEASVKYKLRDYKLLAKQAQ